MSDEIRALLAEKSRSLDANDYYGLLGVPRDAKPIEVKKAYLGLVKQLHPDKIGKLELGAAQPLAARVFKGITDAFNALGDAKRRADYDQANPEVSAENTAPAEVANSPILAVDEEDFDRMFRMTVGQLGPRAEAVATILHGRGSVLFTRGELDEAERYLRRAVELSPNNALFLRKLGWTILKNETIPVERRVQQSRRFLESAVAIDPYNADSRYCMAQLWRAAGELDRYARELEAVLRCKGKHPRAEVELRRFRERQQRQAEAEAAKNKPSLLGRLFKRRS